MQVPPNKAAFKNDRLENQCRRNLDRQYKFWYLLKITIY